MQVPIILLIFQLISLLNFAATLECYQCNSFIDKNCDAKPIDKSYLKPCEQKIPKSLCISMDTKDLTVDQFCREVREIAANCTEGSDCDDLSEEISVESTYCRKSTFKVYGTFVIEEGDTTREKKQTKARVVRGCGWLPEKEEGCVSRGNGGSWELGCTCKESECNGVKKDKVIPSLFLLILLFHHFLH